jgi:hypothetical protein
MGLGDLIQRAGEAIKAFIKWVLLKLSNVIDWFRGRQKLKQEDKDIIAFTIKQAVADGDVQVVQGFFNQRTDEVVDGVKNLAEEIDDELEDVHKGKTLAIYS